VIEKLRQSLKYNARRLLPIGRHRSGEADRDGRRLLFVFQGRIGEWPGMGQQLYRQEPVFREAIRRSSRFVEERLEWSLDEEFNRDKRTYRLHRHRPYVPVALTAIQLALCELWNERGIRPDGVLGYSSGEFAAAYAAGAVSFDDAMALACALYGPARETLVPGKMIVAGLGLEQAEDLCRKAPVPLYVMVELGPSNVLLTWENGYNEAAASFVKRHGIQGRPLNVDSAYHTPLLEVCKAEWLAALTGLKPRPLAYACYSSGDGYKVRGDTILDALYWWRMLSRPVLFSSAIRSALTDGHDTLLFIGAHPAWTEFIPKVAAAVQKKVEIYFSIRSDVPERIMWRNTRGDLKARGFGANPAEVSARQIGIVRRVSLGRLSSSKVALDLGAPEVRRNPYAHYEAMRRLGPIHYMKTHGKWVVLNHENIVSIFQQPALFSSFPSAAFDPVLLGAGPETHNRIRHAVSPLFSRQRIALLTEDITAVAGRLIGAIRARRVFDFVTDFATPLPFLVMAGWLGIDASKTADLRRWGRAVVVPENGSAAELREFTGFCSDLAAARQRAPGNDLVSQMLRPDGERPLETAEAASLTKLLIIAGIETTAHLLGNAFLLLLRRPDVMEAVRAEPPLIALLIEEMLRYDPPVQILERVTTARVEIAGAALPRGANLMLCLGAANRDPERFADPRDFVLTRNPKDHLAFGSGPHRCLGERLARLEAEIALRRLFAELPPLRAAEPLDELEYVPSITIRGLEHLKLTWA
jgi:cytochrome P450